MRSAGITAPSREVRAAVALRAQVDVLLADGGALRHHGAQVVRHPDAAVEPQVGADAVAAQRRPR